MVRQAAPAAHLVQEEREKEKKEEEMERRGGL